jgi:glycosyltransferase involved in cell wall biosynthesis
MLIRFFLSILRRWDLKVNQGVDFFIANSECVRDRIKQFYGRDAVVVNPPANTDFYAPEGGRGDYYLAVSHFVPYKRIDLVIEAFNGLADRKLFVVGSGPMEKRYKALRKSVNIFFLSSVNDAELKALYSAAKALIFPADEDFGIVPVEAQACGTPVIAFQKGGSLETVKSGVFFEEQTVPSLLRAIERFEAQSFAPADVRSRVEGFGRNGFLSRIQAAVSSALTKGK